MLGHDGYVHHRRKVARFLLFGSTHLADLGILRHIIHPCILLLIDMDLLCTKLASTKSGPFPVADVDTFGRVNSFPLEWLVDVL